MLVLFPSPGQVSWPASIRRLRILVVLFLLATLTACSALTQSQQKATHTYASATATLGQFSAAELARLRQDIITMNASRFALRKDKKVVHADFDRMVAADDTNVRLSAARALSSYGELLNALLSEDPAQALEDAAEKLADHTAFALGENFDKDKQSALQSVVENIGAVWVERQRAQALKTIIRDYQPAVQALADLLANDLTLDGERRGFMHAYQSAAKSLKNESYRVINHGDAHSYADRKVAVDALLMAEQALQRGQAISQAAGASLQALRTSDDELLKVLSEKDYGYADIRDYARQIRDLVKAYNALAG
ncbi:MAG: hypothetical protein CMI02_05510 [Oceanospirillaceae bacterium]|nr:hypothetical protein [Oceanospirillaceae bacterium]MBT11476.1 hypothetical protein [Oceanospirillaceae bacterium]|tara:strand:- start:12377 stop:13306 length:930 start_codon:yes stop_codon:yes gene_type:complete